MPIIGNITPTSVTIDGQPVSANSNITNATLDVNVVSGGGGGGISIGSQVSTNLFNGQSYTVPANTYVEIQIFGTTNSGFIFINGSQGISVQAITSVSLNSASYGPGTSIYFTTSSGTCYIRGTSFVN